MNNIMDGSCFLFHYIVIYIFYAMYNQYIFYAMYIYSNNVSIYTYKDSNPHNFRCIC